MERKLQTITDEQDIKAVVLMLRAIASETRLRILRTLYNQPKTWTELMFDFQINPKVLRDNLGYLRKSGLVQRKEPVGFELTEAGCAVMELSLKDIFEANSP